MSKLQRVDKWCPNLITNNEYYAIGEIKTWGEFNTSPINEVWRLKENNFKESLNNGYHYFTVIQKEIHDNTHIILIKTNSLGDILEVRDLNNTPSVNGWLYDEKLNPYKKIIATYLNGLSFELHNKKEDKQYLDISKEAYDLSSELFSFKDMRRGVIEHGKTCYIEGYKKHADLFSNFLLKNGYFSKEELDKIRDEFNESLQKPYRISREDVEKFLPEITCGFEKENWYITNAQDSIINAYNLLTGDVLTLLIKKPRQKGVTSILKTIAYIEATKNNKDVWYLGYGPCYKPLKDCKNITYREIHSFSEITDKECCGKRYDLIIVDEMTAFKYPLTKIEKLMRTLKEGGRIIVVGTIENEKKYDCNKTISRYNDNTNEFFNFLKEDDVKVNELVDTKSKNNIWIGLHKIVLTINDDD